MTRLPIIREQKAGIMAALQSVENIIIEPAAPNARPIHWASNDALMVADIWS